MQQKIMTRNINTKPVSGFTPDIQRAFAAIGQHIDFLLNRTQEHYIHIGYNGSDSWVPGHSNNDKVIIKTFPWDQDFHHALDLPIDSSTGVGVLVRDEFMRPSDMRCLWESYGEAYRSSPKFPLYSVSPHDGKDFQLLMWALGPGCDVFALPGVSEDDLEARITKRSSRGEIITRVEASGVADNFVFTPPAETDAANNAGVISNPRVVSALKNLVQRARV